MYKLVKSSLSDQTVVVLRLSDNAFIPFDEKNADYQEYLKWLDGYEFQITGPMKMEWVKVAESNTPLPADEE
jgi:hypothetical protein